MIKCLVLDACSCVHLEEISFNMLGLLIYARNNLFQKLYGMVLNGVPVKARGGRGSKTQQNLEVETINV